MMKNEPEWVLEADPKRPYKMYASMAAAFIGSLLFTEIGLPVWAKAILTALLAAITVYTVPNPLRVKKGRPVGNYEGDPTLFE